MQPPWARVDYITSLCVIHHHHYQHPHLASAFSLQNIKLAVLSPSNSYRAPFRLHVIDPSIHSEVPFVAHSFCYTITVCGQIDEIRMIIPEGQSIAYNCQGEGKMGRDEFSLVLALLHGRESKYRSLSFQRCVSLSPSRPCGCEDKTLAPTALMPAMVKRPSPGCQNREAAHVG